MRDLLNIKCTFITPYRPKANGLGERTNGTIETILKCMIRERWHEWDKELPCALMVYRATPHLSTKLTPNMLVYGRECSMPCDVMYGNLHNILSQSYRCYCAYVDQLRMTMVDSYEIAHDCLQKAELRQKQMQDLDTVPRQFEEGDWVLFYRKQLVDKRLTSGWTGHQVVVKKLRNTNYRLQRKCNGPTKVVHIDNLMIHKTEEDIPNWITKRLCTDNKQVQTEQVLGRDDEASEQPISHEVLRQGTPLCGPTPLSVRLSSRLASKKRPNYVCFYMSILHTKGNPKLRAPV